MCWKTIGALTLVLIASFFLVRKSKVTKEGFVTYVVYGPGYGMPWYNGPWFRGDGWYPHRGWYRPYWGWRRRWYPYL